MGEAEVDQVGEVVPGHQRVGRFDVAVHQSDRMGGLQCVGQLLDDMHGARGGHRPVAVEKAVDVDAIDHRHHEV